MIILGYLVFDEAVFLLIPVHLFIADGSDPYLSVNDCDLSVQTGRIVLKVVKMWQKVDFLNQYFTKKTTLFALEAVDVKAGYVFKGICGRGLLIVDAC